MHSKSRNLILDSSLWSHLHLSRYLFNLMLTSDLEATHYFATTADIHSCIRDAGTWVENRTQLRKIATEFTTKEKLVVCAYPRSTVSEVSPATIGNVRRKEED